MKKRGKVLRDTSAGAGLLIVDGLQYPFSLEVWRSQTPPKPGMVVEVEFEQYGKIQAIHALNDAELTEPQRAVLSGPKLTGLSFAQQAAAHFGAMNLVVAGLLIISWTAMAAISIQTPLGKLDFTFWQMLGFVNSGNSFEAVMQGRNAPGAGFYGFLALVAVAAPFVRFLWSNKRAALGGLFPLLYMIFTGLMIRSNFENAFRGDAQNALNPLILQMREEALSAVSLGLGTYLSGLASLYFAVSSVRNLLSTEKSGKTPKENTRRAAA
jgi:hypothetical protein